MCDFDLSQALDGSPEETGFESCCFDMMYGQEKTFRLDNGLDLVVSHNPVTLQSVVNLLLAVNRMKKALPRCGKELRDDELCSAILESVVTETIVEPSERLSTGMKRVFKRVNSQNMFTLCDTSQKDIVQASGDLKLQAVTLQGGNCEHKVNFKLSRYICVLPGETQTVLLSLTNNLHISCSMKDGKAELNLEEFNDQKLEKISEDENTDRFLFYKRTTGVCLNTFESVKCPKWFISTSYEGENQPVEMCKVDAVSSTGRLTYFKLN